jgi:hypothetical protein
MTSTPQFILISCHRTKLHGSVNWIKNDDEIEELPYNFRLDDFKSKRGLNDIMESPDDII